jgi:transposase
MNQKNKHSPVIVRFSKHKNLLDFGFKKQTKKFFKKFEKDGKIEINSNNLIKFIEHSYSYARMSLNLYSSKYSKKMYSQPALFTIIALKTYLNLTYRQIVEFISFSDRLQKYLKIKRAPDYSTLQKFFKRMPTNLFEQITKQIIVHLEIQPESVALDGSGFTSDYADKYYSKIRSHDVKNFTKCHIAVDVDSRIILYSQAVKGPRHDAKFAIASIRSLKKYNPQFIIADKAYDSNAIRTCINEEIKASDQIPLRSNFRHGWYRRLSMKTFKKEIYSRRNNVESVFSVIKRKYSGINKSKSTRLQNKETRLKTLVYNIDQSTKI